jgi:hypothetical protein
MVPKLPGQIVQVEPAGPTVFRRDAQARHAVIHSYRRTSELSS